MRSSRSRLSISAAGCDLLLGLAQEVLLARGAHEVGVLVAEAHVLQRLVAAHALIAGRDVDVRVLRRVVVVGAVDVRVDAADRVDRAAEAGEVDVDDVVDRQPGQRLDRVERQLRPAEVIGRVDLVHPVAGDLHLEVARQRHHRDRALVRVSRTSMIVSERAPLSAPSTLFFGPLVRAEDHQRLRLARVGLRQRSAQLQLRVDLERVDDLVDLVERRHRRRARRREHDQHGPDHEPLPKTGLGDVVEGHHAMRRCGSPSSSAPSRVGSNLTNWTSAWRYWPSDRIETHSSGP